MLRLCNNFRFRGYFDPGGCEKEKCEFAHSLWCIDPSLCGCSGKNDMFLTTASEDYERRIDNFFRYYTAGLEHDVPYWADVVMVKNFKRQYQEIAKERLMYLVNKSRREDCMDSFSWAVVLAYTLKPDGVHAGASVGPFKGPYDLHRLELYGGAEPFAFALHQRCWWMAKHAGPDFDMLRRTKYGIPKAPIDYVSSQSDAGYWHASDSWYSRLSESGDSRPSYSYVDKWNSSRYEPYEMSSNGYSSQWHMY